MIKSCIILSKNVYLEECINKNLTDEGLPEIDLILSIDKAKNVEKKVLINEIHKMKYDLNKIYNNTTYMNAYQSFLKEHNKKQLRSNTNFSKYCDLFDKHYRLHILLIKELEKIYSDISFDILFNVVYPEFVKRLNKHF